MGVTLVGIRKRQKRGYNLLTTCTVSVDVEGIPLKGQGMDYSTVVRGIPLLLDLFAEFGINSTFFVTSDAVENTSKVLREIVKSGHEIGCHGDGNQEYTNLKIATETINHHLNVAPIGFRAHRHKINCETFSSLSKLGYKYDSSIVASSRLFNQEYSPRAPKTPYRPSKSDICVPGQMPLVEIPISALPVIKLPLGLSYIKLFGLKLYKFFLAQLDQEIIIAYLHPYDLFTLPNKVDAPLSFLISQKRRINGFKVLLKLLEFIEEKFSPTYIRAKDVLDRSELMSRGGVEPSISTM